MPQLQPRPDQWQGKRGYQLWESSLAQQCGDFHSEPPRDTGIENFVGGIVPVRSSAGFSGARIACNCSRIHRGQQDIKRDNHDYFFLVHQLAGRTVMDQGGAQCVLAPGDTTLLDSAQPSRFHSSGGTEQISLIIPRHRLENSFSHGLRLNHKIPASSRVGHVVGTMATEFFNDMENDEELETIMDALISILRPTLGQSAKSVINHDGKLKLSLFEKARNCIQASLSMPELTPDMVASELKISKRTLYRLFAQRGLSVSRFIINTRLDICAQQFQSLGDTQRISSIAYEWGFNDISHFSRAFKSRFGVSPSDFRSHSVRHNE